MEMVSLLLLACNVLLVSAGGGNYGVEWNYLVNGPIGPSKWSVNHTHCGGTKQSPINILTHHVKYNKDLGELKLIDYDQTATFTMQNRNTDIEFKGKGKNGAKVAQKVQFKGTDYRFYQFHFHWGTENDKGSEHLLNWQRSTAEMHIIHYNDKYPNVSKAVDKEDGLLVWGQFLRVNSINNVANADFQALLDEFTNAKDCCNTKDLELNLFKLLPASHDKFYTYQGGLTTPPCYESVRWVVNKNPILVSEDQMKLYRQLKDSKISGPISNNFRPPQQLNGRTVECNFDPAASKAVIATPCALTILTIMSAMLFTL